MSNTIATINRQIMDRAPYLRDMLPPEITPEKLRTFTLTTLSQNEALQRCSVASLIGAVYASAKVGIEPDGVLACIVPRKGKAQFQLMFRGAVALAQRSGHVRNVWAEVVHEHDQFAWQLGSDPKIEHKPAAGNRGALLYVYACARFKDGYVQFRVMDRAEVMKAREISQAKSGPWAQHEAEMWKKTAIHRLCKQLPLPASAQRALDLDEAAAQERDQHLDTEWEGMSVTQQDTGKVRTSTIDVGATDSGEVTSDQIKGPPA